MKSHQYIKPTFCPQFCAISYGQDVEETTTTVLPSVPETTPNPALTEETDTTTTTFAPEEEYTTFAPLDNGDDDGPRIVPFGVLLEDEPVVHKSAKKKRCRCIEKKRRKVVKEVKYIPLAPAIQLQGSDGHKRNFTCKCSHLRRVVKKRH